MPYWVDNSSEQRHNLDLGEEIWEQARENSAIFSHRTGRARILDRELLAERVRIEKKMFFFSLRDNPRGRFLRITEDVGGRRDSIIIPAPGLDMVRDILDRTIKTCSNTPITCKAADDE